MKISLRSLVTSVLVTVALCGLLCVGANAEEITLTGTCETFTVGDTKSVEAYSLSGLTRQTEMDVGCIWQLCYTPPVANGAGVVAKTYPDNFIYLRCSSGLYDLTYASKTTVNVGAKCKFFKVGSYYNANTSVTSAYSGDFSGTYCTSCTLPLSYAWSSKKPQVVSASCSVPGSYIVADSSNIVTSVTTTSVVKDLYTFSESPAYTGYPKNTYCTIDSFSGILDVASFLITRAKSQYSGMDCISSSSVAAWTNSVTIDYAVDTQDVASMRQWTGVYQTYVKYLATSPVEGTQATTTASFCSMEGFSAPSSVSIYDLNTKGISGETLDFMSIPVSINGSGTFYNHFTGTNISVKSTCTALFTDTSHITTPSGYTWESTSGPTSGTWYKLVEGTSSTTTPVATTTPLSSSTPTPTPSTSTATVGDVIVNNQVDVIVDVDYTKLATAVKNGLVNSGLFNSFNINWPSSGIPIAWPSSGIRIDFSLLPVDALDFYGPTISIKRYKGTTSTLLGLDDIVSGDEGVSFGITLDDPQKEASGKLSLFVNGEKVKEGSGTSISYTTGAYKWNQTVTVGATDKYGNYTEVPIVISNVDSQAPIIDELYTTTTEWTQGDVVVYCVATDDYTNGDGKLQYQWTTNEGGIENVSNYADSPYLLVSTPCQVSCRVKDSVGNISENKVISVLNIDKTAPDIEITQYPSKGTSVNSSDGITLTAGITNTPYSGVAVAGSTLASPLDQYMIKWGDEGVWTDQTSMTFHENKTVKVYVRDSVGNVSSTSYTISDIVDSKPIIMSIKSDKVQSDATSGYVTAPVTYTLTAKAGAITPLAPTSVSWDGGNTWVAGTRASDGSSVTAQYTCSANEELQVVVRDEVGVQSNMEVVNVNYIDNLPPTVTLQLKRRLPLDWPTGVEHTNADLVWQIEVNAIDVGSGLGDIQIMWLDDKVIHANELPYYYEVTEAGSYGVTVTDKVGNITYAARTITAEELGIVDPTGEAVYMSIKAPDDGTAGTAYTNAGGSAVVNVGDIVYGTAEFYNRTDKVNKKYTDLPDGFAGIKIHMIVSSHANRYVTGYVTWDGQQIPVSINGSTHPTGQADMDVIAEIPANLITSDNQNAPIFITVEEWTTDPGDYQNTNGATKTRSGGATVYVSTQVSAPSITYTYDRTSDELTMHAVSPIAGIRSAAYALDGTKVACDKDYTFTVSSSSTTTVTLSCVDNVGNTYSMDLDVATLPVAGEGGGSLPTMLNPNSSEVASYYSSSRSAEIYIIGGTSSNTDNIPSSSVLNGIMSGSGVY